MGFEFGDLYNEDAFKTEFLPHEKVRKGQGLKLDLNRDVVSLDFINQTKSFVENLVSDYEQAVAKSPENSGTGEPEEKSDEERRAEAEKSVSTSLNENLMVMEGLAQAIRQYARILGGKPGEDIPSDRVIRSWDLVRGGKPVPVSYEELVTWKLSVLKKLFNFCVFEAQSVEKKKGKRSANT